MSGTTLLDLGPSDVHVTSGTPGYEPTRTPTQIEHIMGNLDADQRKRIPASKFADPSERKYPVHTKAHADNAAARLEQQKGSLSPGKYASIKRRIKAAQRKFGEKPKEAAPSTRGRGTKMSVIHPDGTRVEVQHRMTAEQADGVCLMPGMPISLDET